MRRQFGFDVAGCGCRSTLDAAASRTGLLIVSGGNEIRIGAHRGMARLAAAVAAQGYPVLRFDRRGVGDSAGENGGWASSAPDIAAAAAALREAGAGRIVGFGNCDAATALVLGEVEVDALVLANPWVVESMAGTPPPAAIRSHYARRLRDTSAWRRLLGGGVSLGRLAKGLRRAANTDETSLAVRFAAGLAAREVPVTIALAARDATAVAFLDQWRRRAFDPLRPEARIAMRTIDSASHSFAGEGDFEALLAIMLEALAAADAD